MSTPERVSIEMTIPENYARYLLKNGAEGKRRLEEAFGVRLEISRDGRVRIFARQDQADRALRAQEALRALSYGFRLEDVLLLAKDEYVLSIVNLKEFIRPRHRREDLTRIRARIIGEKGRAKKYIEQLTKCKISIPETEPVVAIIGPFDGAAIAEEAIRKLAGGAPHGQVYRWLESEARWMRLTELERVKEADLWRYSDVSAETLRRLTQSSEES